MPNILYVHGVSQIGGAERELILWLKNLDQNLFAPFVALSRTGPLIHELQQLDIPIAHMTLPPWRKIRYVPFFPITIFVLVSLIKKWRIDLIHVNDYWWGPLSRIAAKIAGIPCVVHVRQQIEPSKIQKYCLTKPTIIAPVSKNIQQDLVKGGVSPKKIRILLSGIGLQTFSGTLYHGMVRELYRLNQDQLVIGTVANVFPRKGLEFLIQAFARIRTSYPDTVLIIVGTGDWQYEQQLQELIKSLQLIPCVILTGFQANPENFMIDMDVFVLPSLMEGFGIVLLEAMALGKCVVATRVGGIPEIVEHEKTGLLVTPGKVEELMQALLTCITDPSKRCRMGQAAKERVEQQFSIEHMMNGLYEIYWEALGEVRLTSKQSRLAKI